MRAPKLLAIEFPLPQHSSHVFPAHASARSYSRVAAAVRAKRTAEGNVNVKSSSIATRFGSIKRGRDASDPFVNSRAICPMQNRRITGVSRPWHVVLL